MNPLDRSNQVKKIMYQVVLSLVPGIACMVWLFGANVLLQISLAIIAVLLTETAIMRLRKVEILPSIFDGSGILTAILLAISIPPIAPWWVVVIGSMFAIVFGKQIYGGMGNNIFNPAMLGFVMLIISFPKQMTVWSNLDYYKVLSVWQQFAIVFKGEVNLDAITSATPLAGLNTALLQGETVNNYLANTELNNWATINWMFLLGGVYLLIKRLISWEIPTAYLLSLLVISFVFNLIAPETFAGSKFHLLMGATMLGAFFIATDPVSASTTFKGRFVYGVGLGVLIFTIRSFGSFHDAVAFSVVFMNMLVPLIDAYTKPKPFGVGGDK